MKYKLIERSNPLDRTKTKLYASPVNDGTITQKMISTDIMDLSSLSRGDISNVLESLIATMPKYLLMGKSIKLGDFGTLRLSFSSDGVDEAKDFNTNMIRGVKVVFTPSPEFKLALERITFEKSE